MNNIVFESLTKDNVEKAVNLWNKEIGFIYPIDDLMVKQNILECKYTVRDASFFAIENGNVIGFIISKAWDQDKIIESYINEAWISLFYVSKDERKRKIGTTLFKLAEEKLKELNVKKINIGRDINNFFPAVPLDFDNITPLFLENMGYQQNGITHDLIKNCNNELFKYNTICDIKIAEDDDKEKLLLFLEENFKGRWHYEALHYFDCGGYVICKDKDEIVGFMRVNYLYNKDIPYNIMWRNRFERLGGLGPLGVKKEYRKKGIGESLLKYSINYLQKLGATNIMIDWTSLLLYYQKFGFEFWKGYRYYYKSL